MKAIFFDFDGTLTKKGPNIWKSIWKKCGYDTSKESYYAELFRAFVGKRISHKQWCDLTCEKFREAGFNKEILEDIAKGIQLIDGFEETLVTLNQYGYNLHIVSGNILPVIETVLGRRVDYFESMNANDMLFDENGKLIKIKGTDYDFEGKAKLINEFKEQTNSRDDEIIFVGNGSNDEWAHLSGCKTICINPDETDFSDKTKWHLCLDSVSSLTEIIPTIADMSGDWRMK